MKFLVTFLKSWRCKEYEYQNDDSSNGIWEIIGRGKLEYLANWSKRVKFEIWLQIDQKQISADSSNDMCADRLNRKVPNRLEVPSLMASCWKIMQTSRIFLLHYLPGTQDYLIHFCYSGNIWFMPTATKCFLVSVFQWESLEDNGDE